MPKTKVAWEPSADIATLKMRSQFLQQIRDFFHQHNAYEVDTPLLYSGVATDPLLNAFAVDCGERQPRFLQTSPEYAMKRLVAAGSGAIYYLGKAFRKHEVGKRHNPEFTMLEWYRPNWSLAQLIAEVDLLLQTLLGTPAAQVLTYADLFATYFGINPHLATQAQLQTIAEQNGWLPDNCDFDKDGLLDLLLTHGIEPHLGQTAPVVITDYPASQASLAKVRTVEGETPYQVAARFEFYYRGLELANGYDELSCADEQRARFEIDLQLRKEYQLSELPLDEALLAALPHLPACTGVALGVDRVFMLKCQHKDIARVLPFAWERA